jgi:hypothetical protein
MKYLILMPLLLLSGCSLFEKTPSSVSDGQRGVYQSTIVNGEHVNLILDEHLKDNTAAVTYHYNFIYELEIDRIRKKPDLSREEKSLQISVLESKRDSEIGETIAKIESKVLEFRLKSDQNYKITKRLIESVYNYLSTNPIEIDNIDFWIDRLNKDN